MPPNRVIAAKLAAAIEQRDQVAEANARLAAQVRELTQQRDLERCAHDRATAHNVRQANRIRQLEAGLVRLHDGARWPLIPAGQVRAAVQQILRGEA